MVQFAIIGCGRIAAIHAAIIKKMGSLVAVCDIDKEKANAFAGQYHANAYFSIEDLLQTEKEIDVIVVCTPNGLHAEHCIKSLQAGKHVLCEKPFCLTGAAAWQIIETAKFSRKKLMLVNEITNGDLLSSFNNESITQFQLTCLKRWDKHSEDWHNQKFPGGNAMLVHFYEAIETLVFLFGAIEIAETIVSENHSADTIDYSGITALQMKNGILGTINWSLGDYDKDDISLKLISKNRTAFLNGFVQAYESYEESYQSLLREIEHQSTFETDTNKVKVIEAIEKIYKSVSSPIIEEE